MFNHKITMGVLITVVILSTANIAPAQDNLEKTIDRILSLYKEYDVVMLGEEHTMKANYDFRISLISHPRFPEVVNDIVIESGNALYQDILDQYILKLENVPDEELRKVWRNTIVVTGVWDSPIYEGFIRTVRKINEGLPESKRIRLLAGDPPVDWSKVETKEEFMSFLSRRDSSPVEIIKTEVLSKNRKAFVIYGGIHLSRTNSHSDMIPKRNISGLLDKIAPGRIFVLLPVSGDDQYSSNFVKSVGDNHYPVFYDVRNSDLGLVKADTIFFFATKTIKETTDGILFLGSEPNVSVSLDPSEKLDEEYTTELRRRQNIAGFPIENEKQTKEIKQINK